jgi:hypothetical protein
MFRARLWTSFNATGIVNRIELDPPGSDVGTENPYQSNEPEEGNGTLSSDLLSRFGDARDGFGGCIVEGVPASCNIVITCLFLISIHSSVLTKFSHGMFRSSAFLCL